MQISKMNWRQVEDFLKSDDRCVLPLGSTEQHAQLSLCVDMILAERVAFAAAKAIDPTGSHGNWLENFPWTRLEHAPSPTETKPPVDYVLLRASNPQVARTMLGDGSFGGPYSKPDDVMLEIWNHG